MKLFPLLLSLTFTLSGVRADDLLAGHSSHGEAFNEGPRQAAVLIPGTGKVHLPITTRNSRAQKFFDQGVGQLHGFWFFEAERSFRQVAALDTNCAMAYWGMAMANANNQKRAREFIKVATAKQARASVREQKWIDGLARFLAEDKRDKKQREKDYVRSLDDLARAYPGELEAKAILAWKLWELKVREKPYDKNEAVNKLIEDIVAVEPMHPAHHYRIHLWDSANDPKRALASAALCGQSWPGIAHMWHMPGHTFSKLKRYDDAAWQQEASARVDHAHMMKYLVLPDQIHNYAHNNEWLIRDLNFIGRAGDAVSLAKNLIELPRHPKFNSLDKRNGSAGYGRTRLLDTLTRYELWDDVLALNQTRYLEPSTNALTDAQRLRAVGLAAFYSDNPGGLNEPIAALEEFARKLPKPASGTNSVASAGKNRPSAKGGAPLPPPSQRSAPAPKGGPRPAGGEYASSTNSISPAAAVTNALAELRALAALSSGSKTEAVRQLSLAKDIPKDRLARHYLRLGDKSKAEQTARDGLRGATNEVIPLAALVEVLQAAGKTSEAKKELEKLRTVARNLDTSAPVYQRLSGIAESLGLPRDWKFATAKPADVGKRPGLDALGPYRWSPPQAQNWTLRSGDGKKISLSDYRGKPVLVIFFLGHGCLHCIQQLQAVVPMADEFKAAGISIVAVSKDSPAGLQLSLDAIKADGGLPFPLVSDEKLKVFKTYRCFDDFEQTALHGTFLIDGEGAVRWLDISYQPFMETKFLLEESKRLLNLPKVKLTQAGSRKVAQR